MKVKVASMIAAVFLSGCLANEAGKKPSELSPDELPDTVAFQDEFTRDFMKSTEEVGDGLYWFESGTGKYEMLIPGDLQLVPNSYGTQKNDSAEFFLSSSDSENGITGEMQMEFLSFSQPDTTETTVAELSERMTELVLNDRVEKIEKTDQDAYLIRNDFASLAETDLYIFNIVHIQNTNDVGSVTLTYRAQCEEEQPQDCEAMYQEYEDYIMKMIDTFSFSAVNDESE